MWANGQGHPEIDDGTGGKQTYGVHPFALVQTSSVWEYMGIYFRNTNAMSPVLRFTDDGQSLLSFITTGGELEIYFMFRDTAKEIIKKYQRLIGLPKMPPMWALGWHAGSAAFSNISIANQTIVGFQQNDFPLQTFWIDSAILENGNDFKIN